MKQEVIDWAKRVWLDIRSYDPDTVPVRIKSNREKLRPHLIGLEKMTSGMPVNDKLLVDEAIDLLEDFYHYFDNGYRSLNNIDNLDLLCKASLLKILEAK